MAVCARQTVSQRKRSVSRNNTGTVEQCASTLYQFHMFIQLIDCPHSGPEWREKKKRNVFHSASLLLAVRWECTCMRRECVVVHHAPLRCAPAPAPLLSRSHHALRPLPPLSLCLQPLHSSTTPAVHRTVRRRSLDPIRCARLESRLCLSHSLVCTLPHIRRHAPCARVDAAASGRSRSGRAVRSRSAAPRSRRTRSAAGARHERGIEEKQEGWHPG